MPEDLGVVHGLTEPHDPENKTSQLPLYDQKYFGIKKRSAELFYPEK